MNEKLKVVLVDDQNLCRSGLTELLSNCFGISVLGATGTIEGLHGLLQQDPDLLIMDLRMKPLDGLAMLEEVRKDGCSPTLSLIPK